MKKIEEEKTDGEIMMIMDGFMGTFKELVRDAQDDRIKRELLIPIFRIGNTLKQLSQQEPFKNELKFYHGNFINNRRKNEWSWVTKCGK